MSHTVVTIWIEDANGVKYGDGPITSCYDWINEPQLDKAGSFNFKMPAQDERSALIQVRRYARAFAVLQGAVTEIGYGRIEDIKTTVQADMTELEVSGPDGLRSLMDRQVGSLVIGDNTTAAVVYPVTMTDGLTKPVHVEDAYALPDPFGSGLRSIQIFSTIPFSRLDFTFGANKNNVPGVWKTKAYTDATTAGWHNSDGNVTDGTSYGGIGFAQNGSIGVNPPANWDLYGGTGPHNGKYGVELVYSVPLSAVTINALSVAALLPTQNGLAQIMAYAPAGWSLDTTVGFDETVTKALLYFDGDSVLGALTKLAEQTGEHFRLGTGNKLVWLRQPDSVKLYHSGVTGAFVMGETVSGGTSGAVGVIYESDVPNGYLYVQQPPSPDYLPPYVPLDFLVGETVTGASSHAHCDLTVIYTYHSSVYLVQPPVTHMIDLNPDGALIMELDEEETAWEVYSRIYPHGGGQGKERTNLTAVPASQINYAGLVGTFNVSNTITGGTSGATGTICHIAFGYFQLDPVMGTFTVGETVTGPTGHASVSSLAGVFPPPGYELWRSGNRLRHPAAEAAYGIVEMGAMSWSENLPSTAVASDVALAGEMLLYRAVEWLRRRISPQRVHQITITHLTRFIYPGETVQVHYREYRDGVRVINIDQELYVLGATHETDVDGIHTTKLQVSSIDLQPLAEGWLLAKQLESLRVFQNTGGGASGAGSSVGGGGGSPGGSALVTEGPGINLVSTGTATEIGVGGETILAYPNAGVAQEFSATAALGAGFDAALLVVAGGGVITLPKCTIPNNLPSTVTIPAGVTVIGVGSGSIINTSLVNNYGTILDCYVPSFFANAGTGTPIAPGVYLGMVDNIDPGSGHNLGFTMTQELVSLGGLYAFGQHDPAFTSHALTVFGNADFFTDPNAPPGTAYAATFFGDYNLSVGGSVHVSNNLTFTGSTVSPGLTLNSLTTIERNAVVGPQAGTTIFNSTSAALNFYDGANWQPIASGGGGGGLFLPLTGGTLTGGLTITPSPAATALTATGAASITGSSDVKQLVVKANGTQTANLQEWQASNAGVLAAISKSGYIGAGTNAVSDTAVNAYRAATGNVDAYGLQFAVDFFDGTSTSHVAYGLSGDCQVEASGGSATYSIAAGGRFRMLYNASAGNTLTVSNAWGLVIPAPVYTGAGTYSLSPTGMYFYNQGNAKVVTSFGIRMGGQSGSSGTNYAIYTDGGLVRFGDQLSVVGAADRVQLSVTGFTTQGANVADLIRNDGATNTANTVLRLAANSTGTAAAGFGGTLKYTLESSTTADQAAAEITALWNDATHATRKADLVLSAYDTALREGMRIRGAGAAPAIGFYGVAPVVRATTAGAGAAFVAGAGTAVNDASTFGGYTLVQIAKALLDLGLLT